MKKLIGLTLFVAALSLFTSCKKKEEDPTPVATTTTTTPPAVNQPSTTAPSLIPGTNTTLSIYTGAANEGYLDLDSDVLLDPQGDHWSITSVTSSNTNVATVAIDGTQAISYVGIAAGTVTLTVTVADVDGNSNVITFTLTVANEPVVANTPPTLNANANTTFNIPSNPNETTSWDLSNVVTDADGDRWFVISATSSDENLFTTTVGPSTVNFSASGQYTGNGTVTVTVQDVHSNSNTFTASVTVYQVNY